MKDEKPMTTKEAIELCEMLDGIHQGLVHIALAAHKGDIVTLRYTPPDWTFLFNWIYDHTDEYAECGHYEIIDENWFRLVEQPDGEMRREPIERPDEFVKRKRQELLAELEGTDQNGTM